jgi:hypothetical protein
MTKNHDLSNNKHINDIAKEREKTEVSQPSISSIDS